MNSCKSSSLNLKVTTELGRDGRRADHRRDVHWLQPGHDGERTPWSPGLQVTGSGVVKGTKTVFSASVGGVSVNFAGGTYTGNLTTNITAQQPTGDGRSPVARAEEVRHAERPAHQ